MGMMREKYLIRPILIHNQVFFITAIHEIIICQKTHVNMLDIRPKRFART